MGGPRFGEVSGSCPGENEQPSTWHTHMPAPPPGDPPHVWT